MFANLLVAISNINCIFPLALSFQHKDFYTFLSLLFVSTASFVSHLVENHKHGMLGLPFISQQTSYIWNRFDVLGCIIVFTRFLYLYYGRHGCNLEILLHNRLLVIGLMGLGLILFISEYDKYNANLKVLYIITHCIWHLGIFLWLELFLKRIVYV